MWMDYIDLLRFFDKDIRSAHYVCPADLRAEHDRADSLILSARLGGERLETVEFSLSRLMVVQCRELCNGTTPYHKQIIDLVNRNIPVIRGRMAA